MYLSGGGTDATAHLWKLVLSHWVGSGDQTQIVRHVGNKYLYLQSHLIGTHQNVVVDLCACVLSCLFETEVLLYILASLELSI